VNSAGEELGGEYSNVSEAELKQRGVSYHEYSVDQSQYDSLRVVDQQSLPPEAQKQLWTTAGMNNCTGHHRLSGSYGELATQQQLWVVDQKSFNYDRRPSSYGELSTPQLWVIGNNGCHSGGHKRNLSGDSDGRGVQTPQLWLVDQNSYSNDHPPSIFGDLNVALPSTPYQQLHNPYILSRLKRSDVTASASNTVRYPCACGNGCVMNGTSLERDMREIRRILRTYMTRLSDKDALDRVTMEWKTVARVLDRLFFYLYCSAILVTMATIFPRS